MTRIDRLLAQSGLYTRSEARALIRAGRVAAGGVTLTRPEEKCPESAAVTVDGEPVNCEKYRVFMLDKPAGLLSATEDARQGTVLELFPPELRRLGLFPAGRLDKDTTGLLLMTNDGDFAHRVISPRCGVLKTYAATAAAPLDDADAAAFACGLVLADGTECLPAELVPLGGCLCRITIGEGKYHQVKRMLAAIGKPCVSLRRIKIGALEIDGSLGPGGWRELSQFEKELIFGSSL